MNHPVPFRMTSLFLAVLAITGPSAETAAGEPQVQISGLTLELVAREPDIVTPIGVTFDHRGRLLVVESHTHFPPDDYTGPKTDRIRVLEDTDGDGKADRFSTFLDGIIKTMSLRRGPDGWIYVATRWNIFRTRDSDDDGRADVKEVIATLETEGDYPHNGLCGLCFDAAGHLYFGLGENLGKDYTLVGSDGTKLSGGGEGGNIYRCTAEGRGLHQVATGFWNPFGICTDSAGRVFAVGNDPDASPPCRLVHIVEGGDYGYQFRYGRSGKHPLQAWDGELPGTLPMVAGTSEAPSGIVQWHGRLYSSSWGGHRVERFTLEPLGASVSAVREIVVQGDDQFRPVDFAIAPDGSLYFTDWVSRSYNVHGKGRVWRLRWAEDPPEHRVPPLSPAEKRAEQAGRMLDWDALASDDPFLHHAAMMALVDSPLLTPEKFASLTHPRQRLGMAEAANRSALPADRRDQLILAALADPDASVRLYAVRWIAGDGLAGFRPSLDALLDDDVTSVALFKAVLAAREWLDTGKVERGRIAGEPALVDALSDPSRPRLQTLALKSLPPDHEAMTVELLVTLVTDSADASVRREAGRALAVSQLPNADEARRAIADNREIPADIRDDVRAGIAPVEKTTVDAQENPSAAPPPDDIDAWLSLLEGEGSADRGWRVFFRQRAVRCANCHRLDGRGADVGPDLTAIGKRTDRRRLVESILTPSREIAPRYVPWVMVTDAGKVITGMSLGISGDGKDERFLTPDGKQFAIPRAQIDSRKLTSQSIMPDKLHEQLSIGELRDLLSLLSQ